jgi:hypothetical protein
LLSDFESITSSLQTKNAFKACATLHSENNTKQDRFESNFETVVPDLENQEKFKFFVLEKMERRLNKCL